MQWLRANGCQDRPPGKQLHRTWATTAMAGPCSGCAKILPAPFILPHVEVEGPAAHPALVSPPERR
jgi:hypothetical protein